MDVSHAFSAYFNDGVLFKPDDQSAPEYSDGILFKPAESSETTEEELSQVFACMDIENIPLFLAIKKGDFEAVSRLLTLKPHEVNKKLEFRHKEVGEKIKSDLTPLMLAANYNYLSIAELLVLKNAQIDAEVEGWTPLMFAAAQGNVQIVDFLLKKQANSLLANNHLKATALMIAASNGHKEVVDILIKHAPSKGHIMQGDKKGRTAMAYALKANRVDIAQKLAGVLLQIATCLKSNSALSPQNEKGNQAFLLPPSTGKIITPFLNGMTVAFDFAKQRSSTPVKPLFTKEEWRTFEKEQRLKVLVQKCRRT